MARLKWDLSNPEVVAYIERNLKADVVTEFKRTYGKNFSGDGLILLWMWSNSSTFQSRTFTRTGITLNTSNDDLWFSMWFDLHFETTENPFIVSFYEFLAFVFESGEFIKIFGYNL